MQTKTSGCLRFIIIPTRMIFFSYNLIEEHRTYYDMGAYNLRLSSPQDISSFENNVLGKKSFALFVYADWCGHCEQAKPEWDIMSKGVSNMESVKVNEDVFKQLTHGRPKHLLSRIMDDIVTGFPTIAYIKQTPQRITIINYENFDRSAKALKEFFEIHSGEGSIGKKTNKPTPGISTLASTPKAPPAKKPAAPAKTAVRKAAAPAKTVRKAVAPAKTVRKAVAPVKKQSRKA